MSTKHGKGKETYMKYLEDTDYEAVKKFVEDFRSSHKPYHWFLNNCKTFAGKASTACKEGEEKCPWTD